MRRKWITKRIPVRRPEHVTYGPPSVLVVVGPDRPPVEYVHWAGGTHWEINGRQIWIAPGMREVVYYWSPVTVTRLHDCGCTEGATECT